MGIELTNDQVTAIYKGETWYRSQTKQVFEISGPGGSGKSFLIMYLIEKLGLRLDQVLFVAYMGKACSRLIQAGLPAKTIHSAIYDYEKVIARDKEGKIIYKENGKPKKIGKFVLKEKIGKGIKLIVLDEGSMVNEEIAKDLLSFDIPIIVLGDLNQLPPVFGNSFFLTNPDVILTKIMRQNENNPIIYLSQQVLAGKELHIGDYGSSSIISKTSITKEHFKKADIVLTETNRMRWNINNYFREQLKGIRQLDYPHNNEKVICRKNNWSRSIRYEKIDMYMTNGMTGFASSVDKSTYDKKSMMMDFRPDFSDKVFKNVRFNYKYMYAIPASSLSESDSKTIQDDINDYLMDKFEYAYAITVHLSQGSQMDKVLYLHEGMMRNKEDNKKLMYTAITRAVSSIVIVI